MYSVNIGGNKADTSVLVLAQAFTNIFSFIHSTNMYGVTFVPHAVQDAGDIYLEETRQKPPSFQRLHSSRGEKDNKHNLWAVQVLDVLGKHRAGSGSGVLGCNFKYSYNLEKATEPLCVPIYKTKQFNEMISKDLSALRVSIKDQELSYQTVVPLGHENLSKHWRWP